MSTVNAPNDKIDVTVRVFDQFYDFALEVPVEQYDVIKSFFLTVFTEETAADNFTVTIFRIAQETGVEALTILEQIQDQNTIELTSTLAYYINGLRSPATLLGVNTPVVPIASVARNVLL